MSQRGIDSDRRAEFGPKPALGYTPSPLERAADRRGDQAALIAFMAASDAGAYVVGGELIVAQKRTGGHDPLFGVKDAQALGVVRETVFLGLADGAPRFGIGIDPEAAVALKARDDLFISDLRSIAIRGAVAPEHLPPIAEAKAILTWHARHRFCAVCGTATQLVDGGWRRDCPSCKTSHFPRTDPVVIMLAIHGGCCLLGRQSRFAPNMWSCLAGFVEPGESFEDAVRRETREEAGVTCGRVVYFASQPWPFPMSLMIGCHAQALTTELTIDHVELENARWFDREEAALMLRRSHPDGLETPPPVAIAHHIIRAWAEEGDGVLG
jgi:NAD+ diphosphatase